MSDINYKMVEVLRGELRKRKITIKQFSKILNVSEPTAKRWLKGKGLLLNDWLRMINALNLTPMDTLIGIDFTPRGQFEYSDKQEESLSKVPGLLAFFQQLLEGLTPKQIMSDHNLTQSSTTSYLRKLDDIGLIKWEQGLNCSLIKSGEPKWKRRGHLSQTFRERVFNDLVVKNRDSEKLRIGLYRLNLNDIQKLHEMLDEAFQFAKLAEIRSKLTRERSKSIGMVTVNTEYQPDFLYLIPNKK